MLGQRIVTAVILLAILAAAMMSANPWWFVALLALAAACAMGMAATDLVAASIPMICAGVPVLLFAAMLALSSAWLGGAGPGWADPRWILGYAAPAVAAVWLFGGVTAVVRGQSSAPPAWAGRFLGARRLRGLGRAGPDVHRARRGVRGVAAGAGLGGRYRRLFCRPRVRQA